MKGMLKKLRSKKGETLAEILVAILIIAFGAALFAALFSAAFTMNKNARDADEQFYNAVKELEEALDNGTKGTIEQKDGSVQYGGGSVGADVDVFTKDGMSVYKAKTGGTGEGGGT